MDPAEICVVFESESDKNYVYPVEAVEREHFGESSRELFTQSFILKKY